MESAQKQALVAALAKENLTLVDFPGGRFARQDESGRIQGGGVMIMPERDPDEPIRTGGPQSVELSPQVIVYATGNEQYDPPPMPKFARDANGKLWVVNVHVDPTDYVSILLAGCRSGYDKGTTPRDYQAVYLPPKGVRVEGLKGFTIRAPVLSTHHAEGSCRNDLAVP